ncbi:hypothetical protein GCM10010500_66800 [Streptomyces nigrescens]|nr:hypothetical protein GCM10010500_66800 [Streptomyces libani subsp. libani]
MWQAEFQPSGIPAADAEGVVAGVFGGGLDNLASLIAKETVPADCQEMQRWRLRPRGRRPPRLAGQGMQRPHRPTCTAHP